MEGIQKLKENQEERLKNVKKATKQEREEDESKFEFFNITSKVEKEEIEYLKSKEKILIPIATETMKKGKLEGASLYVEICMIRMKIAYLETAIKYREIKDLDERRKFGNRLLTEFEFQESLGDLLGNMKESMEKSNLCIPGVDLDDNENKPSFSRRRIQEGPKVEVKTEIKGGKTIFSVELDENEDIPEVEEIVEEVAEEEEDMKKKKDRKKDKKKKQKEDEEQLQEDDDEEVEVEEKPKKKKPIGKKKAN